MRKPFKNTVSLNIGQVITSKRPFVVRTVLGSYVAICHAIHPGSGPKGDTRYVCNCIPEMKQAGAYTIAQDEATSVVYGVPAQAVKLRGVDVEMLLEQIAQTVLQESKS